MSRDDRVRLNFIRLRTAIISEPFSEEATDMAERIADFIPPPVWNYWASSSSGTVEAYKEFVAFCLDCLIQKKNVETELAKRLALSEPSDKR